MSDLTPKQEAFAIAYIETGNASEAYRVAGYSTNATSKTINEAASRLLADSKIAARVDELRAAQVERLGITVDDLIAELDEARQIALSALKPQSSAAVSATLGKAKLLGLLVDRIDAKVTAKALPASVDDFV
ncbi:MAG: terminase small subunit [Novosphingobium sp.]|nr:terminase small subunit [Novosphingobium sp.]